MEKEKRFSSFRGDKDKLYKNPYFWTCIGISICFILLSIFLFRHSYVRVFQSVKDLISSFRYYAHILFHTKNSVEPSVINIPDDFYSFSFNFNIDWNVCGVRWASWWFSLWNKETWSSFSTGFYWFLFYFMEIAMLLVLVGVIVYFLFQRMFKDSNKETGEVSFCLKYWLKFRDKVFLPCKFYLLNLWDYIKNNKLFYVLWIVLWVFNFNGVTIVIEFLSYYFYFIVSFDVRHLWNQLVKLVGDLSPMFTFIPIWVWVVLVLVLIRRRNLKHGYESLQKLESRNKQFVSSLGISTLICGEMGVGKTSTMTDMALSCSQYFRFEAKDRLLYYDLMFPNFCWSRLEEDIIFHMHVSVDSFNGVNSYRIFNLASVRSYISFLFNHDSYVTVYLDSNERQEYYDGKKVYRFFDAVSSYALLYFIYACPSSLIISNYSIREDNIPIFYGHFLNWDENFFRKKFSRSGSFSHILDFDATRLGMKLNYSKYSDSLEFGVVVITEGGKERLNQLGLQGVKKDSFEANQKNDLFDMWLKLYRHSATVDNFCFGKIFIDEQRPMSLGADLREVCQDVIFIKDEVKNQSVIRFRFFGSFFLEKIDKWFSNNYYRFKTARGDNTLFMYFMKYWAGVYIRRQQKINNMFGFSKLTLQVESGDLDPDHSIYHEYYLCYHKIYSDRYASDCFNDFFFKKASHSEFGINDLPSYVGVTASLNELKSQNSYFVSSLDNIFSDFIHDEKNELSDEKVNEENELKEQDPADLSDGASGNS